MQHKIHHINIVPLNWFELKSNIFVFEIVEIKLYIPKMTLYHEIEE